MSTEDKIQAFLAASEPHPAQSKLEPYEALITGLRKKRWTYRKISESLKTEFGIHAAPSTILSFLKVRAKRSRQFPVEGNRTILPAGAPDPQPKRPRFNIDA